jgi:hypothetical protein
MARETQPFQFREAQYQTEIRDVIDERTKKEIDQE